MDPTDRSYQCSVAQLETAKKSDLTSRKMPQSSSLPQQGIRNEIDAKLRNGNRPDNFIHRSRATAMREAMDLIVVSGSTTSKLASVHHETAAELEINHLYFNHKRHSNFYWDAIDCEERRNVNSVQQRLLSFTQATSGNNSESIQKDGDGQQSKYEWRMRDRMKTVSVALILCLNIGVDPPDVVKPTPCAKLECWIDPFSAPAQKSLELIGKNLQSHYEFWQPRARYIVDNFISISAFLETDAHT
jgi:hypothetical protein